MANGFDYESPLNRLLGVTIPQFLNQQLDRQESSRRFDEQMLAQAAERRQRQANFDRQQSSLDEEREFNKQRVIKDDLYDIDESLIERINSEGDLDRKKVLAEKLSGQFKTDKGANELNAIMSSVEGEKENRQSDLDLYKEIGILRDNEYTILSKNVSSSGYESQFNTIVNNSIKQADLADNRDFQAKFSDVKFIQSKIIQLQKDKSTYTMPGSAERASVDEEIQGLETQLKSAKETLNQYFRGESGGDTGGDTGGNTQAGMTRLKGGGIIPTAILNQFIAGEIDDVPAEYYTAFNDEDYDDLLVQEKLAQTRRKNIRQEAISSVPTAEKLTKKEQALLRRRRKQEEVLGSVDFTGQEGFQSVIDFLRNIEAPEGSMFRPAG
tara:strand:- start:1704 stop:2849 length:1146 start_codon:yes stop_codon:yes gene_type:complete